MISFSTGTHKLLDRLGFSASTICAIHCALMPFALSVLPVLGLGFLAHGAFELGMIIASAIIGTVSLVSSYRLHQRLNPILIMASGALVLLFNFFGHGSHSPLIETLHPYLAAFGGLMIATAHRINMKLCRSCEVCAHDHVHDEVTGEIIHVHDDACTHEHAGHGHDVVAGSDIAIVEAEG
jgi:hypothetical protein